MAERIAVVYNPSARVGRALRKKKKIEAHLNARNIEYDLFLTESEAHLIEITARAVHDYPVIIGVGGDTTINVISREILRAKKGTTLGIISQGSTNDFAKGVGVHKLKDALNAIAAGTSRAIDVGAITCAKDQEPYVFLAQASLGLGVSVNRYVDAWMKRHTFARRFHKLAQATSGLAAIYNSFKTKAVPMNFQLESSKGIRNIDSSLLIFNNTSYFAGMFQVSPIANPTDGKLDCCIFNSASFTNLVRTALQIKSLKHLEDDKVEILQDNYFKITSNQPYEIQLDGEIFRSECEIEVSILPGALNLIINPAKLPE